MLTTEQVNEILQELENRKEKMIKVYTENPCNFPPVIAEPISDIAVSIIYGAILLIKNELAKNKQEQS